MDDYCLSEAEMLAPRIALLGAAALQRYTTHILARGFGELGWDIVPLENAQYILAQVHGAPQSFDDDISIINCLRLVSKTGVLRRCIVLIHRPDEVQIRHPGLSSMLSALARGTIITFLGNWHQNDPYFVSTGLARKVVPHGFFSSRPLKSALGVSVIGTHTSWGEMRKVEHLVKLLIEVFKLVETGSFVGYIGGVPSEDLDQSKIKALFSTLSPELEVEISADYGLVPGANRKHVVVLNPGPLENSNYYPHFNVQLYHLEHKVRTGESSGSVHVRPCIPVILEMNGAEKIEGLEVVKIPYRDQSDLGSIDFIEGAKAIVEIVTGGKLKRMLGKNAICATEKGPRFVADCYAKLFTNSSQ